jgi:hypothetical protein
VDEFPRALRAEVAVVLRGDGAAGTEKISLYGGRRVGGTGETGEYLFSCKSWKDTFSGRKVLVRLSRSRKAWESAEASRMPDGKVRVITAADLGAQPQNAQLREDDTAGLEALAERLELAGESDGPVNLTAAGWVVGRGRPQVDRCSDPGRYIRDYGGRRLNDRQRQAIEQALASEVTFIWGPPGTGKTDVVGYVVEGCYRQGLRALFLAPTHVAVDQALERMCELLSQEEGLDSGLVQRAGKIEVASLVAKYGEQIIPERIAARLVTELDVQITQVGDELEEVREGVALHEDADRISAELTELSTRRETAGKVLVTADRDGHDMDCKAACIQRKMDEIGMPSGLFAERKHAKLEALRRELRECQTTSAAIREQRRTAMMERQRCTAGINAAESRLAELRVRLRGTDRVERLSQRATTLQERLDHLQEERRKITEAVRSRCRVMGTTVSRAVQSRKLMDAVDVVVIDEAGMVNLPSAWYAAGLAGKRLVVAGDFRQLPAVTRGSDSRDATPEDKAHSKTWMDRDAFHAAGLVDERDTARDDPRLVALNTQYRMRPAICAVVNAIAYPDAPLLTGRDDAARLPASPLIESPLILIDTAPRRLPNVGGRYGGHKSNAVHEAVIHEFVRGLQYDTVLPARKWTNLPEGHRPTDSMAVIAPYREQVKALQASQRPLVIIDTVAGAGDRLGYFYEGTGLSSHTCRLLNVALSRAQDHLVVVADLDFLHRKLDASGEAARMLAFLEGNAQRLSVDDLVPFRSADDLAGLNEDELARPAFFPADEVSRAVEWDLHHARRSITCAFMLRCVIVTMERCMRIWNPIAKC